MRPTSWAGNGLPEDQNASFDASSSRELRSKLRLPPRLFWGLNTLVVIRTQLWDRSRSATQAIGHAGLYEAIKCTMIAMTMMIEEICLFFLPLVAIPCISCFFGSFIPKSHTPLWCLGVLHTDKVDEALAHHTCVR